MGLSQKLIQISNALTLGRNHLKAVSEPLEPLDFKLLDFNVRFVDFEDFYPDRYSLNPDLSQIRGLWQPGAMDFQIGPEARGKQLIMESVKRKLLPEQIMEKESFLELVLDTLSRLKLKPELEAYSIHGLIELAMRVTDKRMRVLKPSRAERYDSFSSFELFDAGRGVCRHYAPVFSHAATLLAELAGIENLFFGIHLNQNHVWSSAYAIQEDSVLMTAVDAFKYASGRPLNAYDAEHYGELPIEGMCLYSCGEKEKAIEIFEQVCEEYPEEPKGAWAMYYLTHLYAQLSDFGKSREVSLAFLNKQKDYDDIMAREVNAMLVLMNGLETKEIL